MHPQRIKITRPDGVAFKGYASNATSVVALKILRLDRRRAERGLPMATAYEPKPGHVRLRALAHGAHCFVDVDIRGAVVEPCDPELVTYVDRDASIHEVAA